MIKESPPRRTPPGHSLCWYSYMAARALSRKPGMFPKGRRGPSAPTTIAWLILILGGPNPRLRLLCPLLPHDGAVSMAAESARLATAPLRLISSGSVNHQLPTSCQSVTHQLHGPGNHPQVQRRGNAGRPGRGPAGGTRGFRFSRPRDETPGAGR